jgi:methanogenic corrinoid protein MtbC1
LVNNLYAIIRVDPERKIITIQPDSLSEPVEWGKRRVNHAGISVYRPVKLDRDDLAGKALDRFGKKHPGTWRNSSAFQKMQVRDEFRDLVSNLEESLAIDNPAIFIDHARWAKIHFSALHLPKNHVSLLLETLGDVLKNELPPDFRKQSDTFIAECLNALKNTSTEVPSFITENNPLADVARSFLDAFIAADRERAERIVRDAVEYGTPLKDIYLHIFHPVLQETGRLWQSQQVSIAEEHFITATIETLMARLHDQVLVSDGGGKGRRGTMVIAAGVGVELHEIGIHMVSDFFEMDGWDTYYTGANTPVQSILGAARDRKADIIALSVTMPRHLPDVQYLIRSLRAERRTTGAKIIVGGYPFRIVPDLWKQVGADAYAETAEEAVAVADSLVPERR